MNETEQKWIIAVILGAVLLLGVSGLVRGEGADEPCVPEPGVVVEQTEQVTGITDYAVEVRPVAWKAGKIVGVEVKYLGSQVTVGDMLDTCGELVEERKAARYYIVSYYALPTPISTLTKAEADAIGWAVVAEKGLKAEMDEKISELIGG